MTIADDPCDEWPFYPRWEPARDGRIRSDHAWASIFITHPPEWNVEPPSPLGRFNCRGDYVLEDGTVFPAIERYRKD